MDHKHSAHKSSALAPSGSATVPGGEAYVCPMHPEVTSTEPGKCPKCGMNLEEVTAGTQTDSAADHQHEAGEQH